MKTIAALLLSVFLHGCCESEHVSPEEFKKQYAWTEKPQTMHSMTYLDQHDGRAFIRVSSMSIFNGKWNDRVIYVDLAELDPALRSSLPKTKMKAG